MRHNAWKGKATASDKKKRQRQDSEEEGRSTADKSFDAIIADQRRKILQKRDLLPELREKLERMETELRGMGAERRHIRAKRQLSKDIGTFKETVRRIETGVELQQFEECIKPYVTAHDKSSAAASKDAGGGKKRRRKARKLSDDNTRKNKRKSTKTNRRIRVSTPDKQGGSSESAVTTILDELADELQLDDEYEGAVYVCSNNTCPECGPGSIMRKLPHESLVSCDQCGMSIEYLDSTSASSGHDDMRSFPQFSYKKVNHFVTWLKQCQAKEVCTIEPEIIEKLCFQLRQQQIKPEEVTPRKVRECLKKLKQRKYYEHSVLLCCILTGKEPPRLSPAVESKLENMFLKIQDPFVKACALVAPQRKNFLSYSYVCFKFCQIIEDFTKQEREEWLGRFVLLKGKDKLFLQDQIWKEICRILSWPYFPSV